MKNIVISVLLLMVLFCFSGCTLTTEKSANHRILSDEEKEKLDLRQDEEPITRSIDDICVHEKPLVAVEKIYDETDKMVQYFTYEYDDKNRYTTVNNYVLDAENGEMELYVREDYSYEDYFYSIDTTYAQENGLVSHIVYDIHDNEIVATVPNKDYTALETMTFQYRYPVDTKMTTERYRYYGEGMGFVDYSLMRRNAVGDEIYYIKQSSTSVHVRTTDYEYDKNGRILSKSVKYTDNHMNDEEISFYNACYTYNSKGNVTEENEKYELNIDTELETVVTHTTVYGYDDRNRLVYKTEKKISEGDALQVSGNPGTSTTTRYEYADE